MHLFCRPFIIVIFMLIVKIYYIYVISKFNLMV